LSRGTHALHLCRGKLDANEMLAAFFRTGLRRGELCLWIVSNAVNGDFPVPPVIGMTASSENRSRHRRLRPIPYQEWYFDGNRFSAGRALSRLEQEIKESVEEGYTGVRVGGEFSWLRRSDWVEFLTYEWGVSWLATASRITMVCCYEANPNQDADLVDMVRRHTSVIAKRDDDWETIDTTSEALPVMSAQRTMLQTARETLAPNPAAGGKNGLVSGRAIKWLTTGEAARMLGVHANTVRQWNAQGVLPARRIGSRGYRRFDMNVVRAVASSSKDFHWAKNR